MIFSVTRGHKNDNREECDKRFYICHETIRELVKIYTKYLTLHIKLNTSIEFNYKLLMNTLVMGFIF